MEKLDGNLVVYLGKRGGLNELTLEIFHKYANNDFVISEYNEERNKYQGAYLVTTFKSFVGFFFTTIFRLPFELIRFKFSVINKSTKKKVLFTGFHPWDIFFIYLLKKKFSINYIIHDPKTHIGENNKVINFLQNAIMKNPYVNIVALSNFSADMIESNIKKEVQRWAINDFFTFSDKPYDIDINIPLNIFFFGRIIQYKGFDKIPIIMEFLEKNSKFKFKLVIRGDGDKRIITDLVESYLHHDVDCKFGWYDNKEIEFIMRQNTIIVLPYDEATQSGIIPQAIAIGANIVVTPVGALAEQLEGYPNSVISTGIEADNIGAAIINLLNRKN